MNITIEQITALAPIPEDLHDAFLRVAKGLTERAEYPTEKVRSNARKSKKIRLFKE